MAETTTAPQAASAETTTTQETGESAEVKIDKAPNAIEKPKEVQPNKKKFKLKVDGNEEDFELDLNNEEEIKKHLQMSKAAHKRMQEAAKIRQQAEGLIKAFNENPLAMLKKLDAKKVRTAAEEFLVEQLKAEMMSPEEKTRNEQLAKLKDYEEKEKKQNEDAEKTKADKVKDHWAQTYSKTIAEALEGSGLPRTPTTIKRMAKLLSTNLELGLDLSPKDLIDEVRKSYFDEFKELCGNAPIETILQMFGDDLSNKIRKHDLAKLMSSTKQEPAKPQMGSKNQKRDYMTMDEWRESLRK